MESVYDHFIQNIVPIIERDPSNVRGLMQKGGGGVGVSSK